MGLAFFLLSVQKVQFSRSVMSNTLQSHGLQHARFPCPSQTHRACSSSCLLSQWCHPLSSPSPPTFYLSQHHGLFNWVSSLHQVAKVLEFHLQHQSSNEYSGLTSFRTDGCDLLVVQGTLKSLLQHHRSKVLSSLNSQFFSTQLSLYANSHIHTWLLEKPYL